MFAMVTALVAVRIEIPRRASPRWMQNVTALVAVRIEISIVVFVRFASSSHRPCGGED